MSQTQTNTDPFAGFTQEEKEIGIFVETIVRLVTGYSIAEIPETQREKIALDCLKTYNNFVLKYIEVKYGQRDATRLKANQKFPHQDIFSKFEDLGPKFDEAFEAFVDTVVPA